MRSRMMLKADGGFLEKRSIDYVPLAERHGKAWHLWPIWFAGDAHLATLAVGVLGIALGGNLLWTGIAVVTGCAIGTFFMAFHSTQGPTLGLPQLIQSRPQFGYSGALLVCAVALFAYIGYNAFNQVLAVQAVHQLFPSVASTSPTAIVIFAGAAATLSALGYDEIHLVQRVLAFFMIALLSLFSIMGAPLISARQLDPADFHLMPFAAQLFAAASYQVSWSIYVSDYSRYLPREVGGSPLFWWTYLGAFTGGAWMMLIGSVVAAANPALDVAAAIEHAADAILPGLGPVLLVGAILGLVTISSLNFYGASLTLLCVADSVRPLKPSAGKRLLGLLVAAACATAIAWNSASGFVARFADLLALQLYLFTPWTAINLVDFYLVRRGHYSIREIFNPAGMYGRWNWRGLLAYGLGFSAMIPFFNTKVYTGPLAVALGGTDVSMPVGLAVSAICYYVACRSFDVEEDRRRATAADIALEPMDHRGPAPIGNVAFISADD